MAGAAPLAGVRVAVTRPAHQAAGLEERLQALGGEVLRRPLTRIEPPLDEAALRGAVLRLAEYDWLVLTSANGVLRVGAVLREIGVEPASVLTQVRIACVGPATAEAMRVLAREPDIVPAGRFVGEGLLEALSAIDLAGARVLLAQAEGARPVLREGLRAAGAVVDAVVAYRTVPDPDGIEALAGDLARGDVDIVAFSAASGVKHLATRVGDSIGTVRIAVIGPETAAAVRAVGWPVHAEAAEHTEAGLAEAVVMAARQPFPAHE